MCIMACKIMAVAVWTSVSLLEDLTFSVLKLAKVPYIVEKFGTPNYSTLLKNKLNQNYSKVEMNNKVVRSPASWRKKKALHFLAKSNLEIIKECQIFRRYTVTYIVHESCLIL